MKTALDLVSMAKKQINEISVEQAPSAFHKADVIIDIREPAEYAAGHIKDAILLPRGVLEFKIANLPAMHGADTQIVLYCQSSGRAALAAQSLAMLGYQQVLSIAGGFDAWLAADMPVIKPHDGVDFG